MSSQQDFHYSDRVRKILAKAEAEAASNGSVQVGTSELVIALLTELDPRRTEELLGPSRDEIESAIRAIRLDEANPEEPNRGGGRYTPAALQAIAGAVHEAKALSQQSLISPGHLLLGILRPRNPVNQEPVPIGLVGKILQSGGMIVSLVTDQAELL